MKLRTIKIAILLLCIIYFKANAQQEKPNILFIAIDDMNDWTGFLGGHPQAITPNLDKIAERGVNFTNAHTAAPGCSPSRNALLYGIEPFNSGLYPFYDSDIHRQLNKEYTSLPKLLKDNGYVTFGAGKIHHAPIDDSGEWSDYFKSKPIKKRFKKDQGFIKGKNAKYSYRATLNPDEEHIDHQVASYGVEKLQQKHEKPFFLAVGIVKPHLPFDAPARFFENLPKDIIAPDVIENDLDDIPKAGKSLAKKGEYNYYLKENAWEDVRRAYLACISWADYNIGRVLDALENSEYANNTIVIIWSDHGYHLGEKMTFKKFTLWEESTRVPFIIYDGRENQKINGRKYTGAISLINVYKTIADFVDLEVNDYVDGESLVPLLNNQSWEFSKPAITTWGRGNYSVRNKKYRYTRYFDGGEELYNHEEDPNEWNNLANISGYEKVKKELSPYIPKKEKMMIPDYVSKWSIEGADKAKYRK
jgi:arylsulfatase A-like enzyme